MFLTLYTSGSTDKPKQVQHTWEYINKCALLSAEEIGLTENDKVLNVFPGNTIAHYTITCYPATLSKASLFSAVFDPYSYIEYFQSIQPTVISLIPRHLEILKKTKGFSKLNMSCVRYMITGSSKIDNNFIDTFRDHGVKLVANWYGMTEVPPPVMIGYNTTFFTKITNNVTFTDEGECVINGWHTGDIFDIDKMIFLNRKLPLNGKTWKTNF